MWLYYTLLARNDDQIHSVMYIDLKILVYNAFIFSRPVLKRGKLSIEPKRL